MLGTVGAAWSAQRLTSFVAVLALGFLLLLSLVLSAVLGVIGRFFGGLVPAGAAIGGEVLNLIVSPLAVAVLFALIFKFVPDVPIGWRDVVVGAVVTSILFGLGRALLSFYFARPALALPMERLVRWSRWLPGSTIRLKSSFSEQS